MTDTGPADHELVREKGSTSWTVLRLVNNSSGVPTAIDVSGSFSCLTCKGFVEDDIICYECRAAIQLLRSGPHQQALSDFLSMIVANPGFLRALEHMTDEALTAYFIERLRHPGD